MFTFIRELVVVVSFYDSNGEHRDRLTRILIYLDEFSCIYLPEVGGVTDDESIASRDFWVGLYFTQRPMFSSLKFF